MNPPTATRSTSPTPPERLMPIYRFKTLGATIFLDALGELCWAYTDGCPHDWASLPKTLQAHILLKFIQDHRLAERLRFIKDPLVGIGLYLKACYLFEPTR